MMALAMPLQAKIYLVSAGVSDYPGDNMDLNLPAKDAQKIAWLYGKNSKVVYKLLTNSDATQANITNAIRQTFADAKPDDIVVFFFSGHGYPGGFCAYDGNLEYETLRKAMAQSKSKNKMIFADACFAGKIATEGTNNSNSVAEARKANVMLFLSSRRNETSLERRDMDNGFFTTALQNGLRGKADANRDRKITARELFEYVSKSVKKMSNDRQHPVMWGKFPNSMVVMQW